MQKQEGKETKPIQTETGFPKVVMGNGLKHFKVEPRVTCSK